MRMRSRRPLLLLALLAVCGGAAVWGLGARSVQDIRSLAGRADLKAELDLQTKEGGAMLALNSVELVHGGAGQPLWKLKAASARYLDREEVVEVQHPEITYYVQNETAGQETLQVNATRGVVRQNEGAAMLWGGVQAKYRDSLMLANQLTYNASDRSLVLSGDVQLIDPKVQMNSTSLRLLLDSRRILVNDGVRAAVMLEENEMNQEGDGAP